MDEYQLIEISKRFRVLEDAIEESDAHLARGQQEAIRRQVPEVAGTLGDVRDAVDAALGLCRKDMRAMQEEIRARITA